MRTHVFIHFAKVSFHMSLIGKWMYSVPLATALFTCSIFNFNTKVTDASRQKSMVKLQINLSKMPAAVRVDTGFCICSFS